MAALSLGDLVQALANSVIDAQNLVENQQISLLSRFFDENSYIPACIPVRLPRMGLAESGDNSTVLQVPLLSLVEPTMLHITEFQVSFDVELSGLDAGDGLDHGTASPAETAPGPVTSATNAGGGVAAADAGPARQSRLSFWRRLSRSPAVFDVPVVFPDIGPRPVEDGGAGPAADPIAARDLGEPIRTDSAPPMPAMMVGLGPKAASTAVAKATLKVSSRPMSDGMVRLLNQLNKTF